MCRSGLWASRNALDLLARHGSAGKRLAPRHGEELTQQRGLVAVGKQQAADPVPNDLSQTSRRAGDHRHSTDHRFERHEAERLGPERRYDHRPGVGHLTLHLFRSHPAAKLYCGAKPERHGQPLERLALRTRPHDAETRRG